MEANSNPCRLFLHRIRSRIFVFSRLEESNSKDLFQKITPLYSLAQHFSPILNSIAINYGQGFLKTMEKITVSWFDEAKTAILCTYNGDGWTWEDFFVALQ